jgi:trk system potassium uptake protein TrkH
MLHFLGFILLIIGGVMLVPLPLTLLFNELHLVPYFLIPAAVAILLGFALRSHFGPTEFSLGKAMVMVTASWILFSAFSSVPYICGRGMSVEDAYFESMSGLTATGLTMISDVEATARTILFWRSLTEWVGGMGVIVLFLSALVGFGKAARKLYVAEARTERIEPSVRQTTRSLWKIYVTLTALGTVGLYLAGMPLFEAVNHSMTGIATGGFSVRNTSFAGYAYPVLGVTILIMMSGAISFAVHRRVMAGHFRELFRNPEVQLMVALIAVSTLTLVWSAGLSNSLFQTTSALTGTGFSNTDLANWSDLQKGLLTVLMVVGGGYGSTSSAIKLIRIIIIGKAVYWMIKRSFLPDRAVIPTKIAGREYTEQEMMETAVYAFIYLVVLTGGAVVLMMLGNPVMNSLFESASAQGNVGLSVGITSASMPLAGKISLTIQMLVGRLEIIPVIAFLGYLVSKVPRPRPKPF